MKERYKLHFRRRREGKTNYKKRLRLLLSRKARLVVRITNKRIITQIIDYDKMGDKTLVFADSKELIKYGWKYSVTNLPAAYLTGMLCTLKAKKRKINEVILDIGLHTPTKGAKVFAVLKGAVDAGLNIPYDDERFPDEEKIKGAQILQHRNMKDIVKDFEKIKTKLSG